MAKKLTFCGNFGSDRFGWSDAEPGDLPENQFVRAADHDAALARKDALLREIIAIAESNPGGYLEPGSYDPNDQSPEDATVINASEIRRLAMEALGARKEAGG